jgi:multidrug resistance protein
MFARLSTLIITAFVDMIGLLMILPLLPFYARNLGANGLLVALLVSSFTTAQLLSAPLWGRVSDRYGRRPALLIGLGASAIAYVVFAYANSLWLLLLSRIVQGAGGGTTGVIQAYVADTTTPDQRAKALGWLSAATNVGVALGPPIGSYALSQFGHHGPGLIAATLCVVNMVFAWRYLSESHDITKSHAHKPKTPRQAITHVLTHPTAPAPRLIWMYAIAIGAFQGMTAILALFLLDKFQVGANHIWIVFTYIGAISVITRAGILGRAVDKYGEITLARIGLTMLAIGLGTFPLMPTYPLLAVSIALMPLGTAFTFPCVTSLLSRIIQSHERGLYMGLQQTFGGISRVLVPIWAGFAYDHLGRSVPFLTSSLMVLFVLFLAYQVPDTSTA